MRVYVGAFRAYKQCVCTRATMSYANSDEMWALRDQLQTLISDGRTRLVGELLKLHPALVNCEISAYGSIHSPFVTAVMCCGSRRDEMVEMLIECNVDVNASDRLGTTPLAKCLNVLDHNVGDDAITGLLKHNANVNACTYRGITPLMYAVENHYLRPGIIAALINANADVNAKDAHDRTALLDAVRLQPGYTNSSHSKRYRDAAATAEIIRILLANGADVNAQDYRAHTPLHRAVAISDGPRRVRDHLQHDAVAAGRLVVVQMLLDHGADVNPPNLKPDYGINPGTPLHDATKAAFHEGMVLLIEHKADVNAVTDSNNTALHLAAENGFAQCMNVLLDGEANITAHNHRGYTPLHSATGHLRCMAVLLGHSASVDVQDNVGSTPLHVAANDGRVKSMMMLLEHEASVDAEDFQGLTPLHDAAKGRKLKSMEVLLERGANVEARTDEGATPLHTSASNWFTNGIQLLLRKNVDIEAKTTGGKTPLQMALTSSMVTATEWGHNPMIHGDYFDTVFTLILRGAVRTTEDGRDFAELERFREYVNFIRAQIDTIIHNRSDETAAIANLSDVKMMRTLAVDLGLPTLFGEVVKSSTQAQIRDLKVELARGPSGNWADNLLRDLCRPLARANHLRTIDGRATILTVLLVCQRLMDVRDSVKVLVPSADADLAYTIPLPAVPIELWIETLFKFMQWDPHGHIIATAADTISSVITHRGPRGRIGRVSDLLVKSVRCHLEAYKGALLHYQNVPKALSVEERVKWYVNANNDVVRDIDADVAGMMFGCQNLVDELPRAAECTGSGFAMLLRVRYHSGFRDNAFQNMVFALVTAACCVAYYRFTPDDFKHPVLQFVFQFFIRTPFSGSYLIKQKQVLMDARDLRNGVTVFNRECAQMAAGWVGLFFARLMEIDGKQTLSEGAILALNSALYEETEDPNVNGVVASSDADLMVEGESSDDEAHNVDMKREYERSDVRINRPR